MKVLTAAQMREVDHRTEALGISGPILMENAAHRVVEFLGERFGSFANHHIVIVCGKGNNGGDGFVVARQLITRFRIGRLDVVAVFPDDFSTPRQMLEACCCKVADRITPEMHSATIVIDAVLGTGVTGAARGPALEAIGTMNSAFRRAFVLSIDLPSGMNSDSGTTEGEFVRADATVTFTAPKICHVVPPNCDAFGDLRVVPIGSPASLMNAVTLHLNEPSYFRHLLGPRPRESNKGTYGHVLVVGGAQGKSGAAEMTGLAAMRAGAGLVTVASSAEILRTPELMTSPLPDTAGALSQSAERMNVIALGPGLGTSESHAQMVRDAVAALPQGMVIDADGLNALAGHKWTGGGHARVLTPHPGEMGRLAGITTRDVQQDRISTARNYAVAHGCILVLKGYRTVIAAPDGRVWVNPTGTPALAKGGTGDVLTGMIAGLLAQHAHDLTGAVLAGVYLHGAAAKLAEKKWGEYSLLATELLEYLPEAIRECSIIPDKL